MNDLQTPKEKYHIIEYMLKYSYISDNNLGNYIQIIFSILLMFFIFPFFILLGYIGKVQNAVYDDNPMPKFEKYDELYELGFNLFRAYTLPISIIILSIGLTIGFNQLFFLGFSIFGLYMWPAIRLEVSQSNSYKEIFNIRFFEKIFSEIYFKYFLFYLLFLITLLAVYFVLTFFTFLIAGFILLPMVLFSRVVFWGVYYKEVEKKLVEEKE